MKPKGHSFNVLLDSTEYAMLIDLKRATGFSAGLVLRQALRARHAMQLRGAPTCATGNPCLVPHMFAQQPAPAPTNVNAFPNPNDQNQPPTG